MVRIVMQGKAKGTADLPVNERVNHIKAGRWVTRTRGRPGPMIFGL